MALLQDILYRARIRSVQGNLNLEIKNLQTDSRNVSKGSAFIAVKGVKMDGHEFIEKAIANGAIAIIAENLPEKLNEKITYVQVENSAEATGLMAHNFFGQPSEKLKLVGVT